MKAAALAVFAYCAIALAGFGSILSPVVFMSGWSYRLGAPGWQLFVFASFFVGAGTFILPERVALPSVYRPAAFVAVGMALSVLSVGFYADALKHSAVQAFESDASFEHPIFMSFHEAPREFQFYLHAAALKRCVPFAWSYREMGFYQLKPDIAANVLPKSWMKACSPNRQ